jgi:hypothetical protein
MAWLHAVIDVPADQHASMADRTVGFVKTLEEQPAGTSSATPPACRSA